MEQDRGQELKDRMSALRERSGKVESDDPLVSFLYQLMRDHLAPGVVESLMADWQGEPITLQLDHINGVHSDCRRDNLRWLCPNCHSQTSTWGAKQRGRRCQDCGRRVTSKSIRCRRCTGIRNKQTAQTRTDWPSVADLCAMLVTQSYVAVAAHLGVSDAAVRKRLRKNGIDPKTLGARARKNTSVPDAGVTDVRNDTSLTTE